MSSLNQSYGIAQEINIERFYFHLYDEYLIAPVRHIEIVLGEVFYGMFKGFISTFLIFVYAMLFRVGLVLSPVFFLAILVHTFLFASLGTTMAMVIKDHGSQATVNTFVITPMIFLCGTFFPVDKLPYVFKLVVYMLPLTYSTKVIRASLTGQEVNLFYLLLMAIYGLVFFVGATVAIRKVES
jgi:ABC-type multidrug transport system permease subunit